VSAEARLKELKIDLGTVSAPVANYVNAVRTGNLLFLSGKGPRAGAGGKRPKGKLGREYTVEQGYQQARTVGLDLLAVMRSERGKHARSAVGMSSLPMGIPVEIECIVEVE
jgi:enamine deaminase RidA (YjgF/YER057c/UK114 family)